MHALATCFLGLYLAHLLTDFVFQSDRLVTRKSRGSILAYGEHGGIHFLAATLFSGLAVPGLWKSVEFYGFILGLTFVHLGIDWGKLRLIRSNMIEDGAASFLGDQAIHFLTVCITAWLIARPSVLSVIAKMRLHISGETTNEMQNAGMYIGWLERFVVLTALVLQSPATVGLILTAKSIARYPELKSVRFAEYFLIGTLLSVSLGIVGGLILLKAFYGTVTLSK